MEQEEDSKSHLAKPPRRTMQMDVPQPQNHKKHLASEFSLHSRSTNLLAASRSRMSRKRSTSNRMMVDKTVDSALGHLSRAKKIKAVRRSSNASARSFLSFNISKVNNQPSEKSVKLNEEPAKPTQPPIAEFSPMRSPSKQVIDIPDDPVKSAAKISKQNSSLDHAELEKVVENDDEESPEGVIAKAAQVQNLTEKERTYEQQEIPHPNPSQQPDGDESSSGSPGSSSSGSDERMKVNSTPPPALGGKFEIRQETPPKPSQEVARAEPVVSESPLKLNCSSDVSVNFENASFLSLSEEDLLMNVYKDDVVPVAVHMAAATDLCNAFFNKYSVEVRSEGERYLLFGYAMHIFSLKMSNSFGKASNAAKELKTFFTLSKKRSIIGAMFAYIQTIKFYEKMTTHFEFKHIWQLKKNKTTNKFFSISSFKIDDDINVLKKTNSYQNVLKHIDNSPDTMKKIQKQLSNLAEALKHGNFLPPLIMKGITNELGHSIVPWSREHINSQNKPKSS